MQRRQASCQLRCTSGVGSSPRGQAAAACATASCHSPDERSTTACVVHRTPCKMPCVQGAAGSSWPSVVAPCAGPCVPADEAHQCAVAPGSEGHGGWTSGTTCTHGPTIFCSASTMSDRATTHTQTDTQTQTRGRLESGIQAPSIKHDTNTPAHRSTRQPAHHHHAFSPVILSLRTICFTLTNASRAWRAF